MIMASNRSAIRCFTARDADPGALDGERIAVLGYGHLGRPFALNLRDSGVASLIVGNIDDAYAEQASADGFTVLPPGQAAAAADSTITTITETDITN
jgi:ketol-acid reductoisomerase